MGYLGNTKLEQATSKRTDYSRYVDDTFAICNSKRYAIHMFKRFNRDHRNIEFTIESVKDDMF